MFHGRTDARQEPNDVHALAGRQAFLTFGDWTIRPAERFIERRGERHILEPRLMDVLVYLARHPGHVAGTEELLGACWPGEAYGDNPVHKCIAMLRRVLGDDARHPRYIATVRKHGYRVLAPVSFGNGEPHSASRVSQWTGGSPYVGARPFAIADAPVFFGRRADGAGLLDALRRGYERRFALALVTGPAGCGTTSLIHAGIAAVLLREAGHDGLRAVAHASVRASAAHDDALTALVSALCTWHVDGEPVFVGTEQDALAHSLRGDAELVLARLRGRLRGDGGVLLLLIDDMDTLLPPHDLARAREFMRALSVLVGSGMVAAIGTCGTRRAAWLARLGRSAGHQEACIGYALSYPGAGQIANMVRGPAELARLAFEEDAMTERRLDDKIIADVAHAAWPLATMQGVLSRLFESREQARWLTFAGYRRALGEISGPPRKM